jgi:hypothetical protein
LLAVKKFSQCYELAKELGSGAFSVVKLGIHKVSADKTLNYFLFCFIKRIKIT